MLSLTLGCGSKKSGTLEAFYYPFDSLLQGRVYVYAPVGNDTVLPVYWYFKTHATDSGRFMSGCFLDEYLNQRQFIREKWVDNGTLMQYCRILEPDSLLRFHEAELTFRQNAVFPFRARDSNSVFLFNASFRNPIDTAMTTTLIRNRRYIGDTSFAWQGRRLDAIRLSLKEAIETRKDGIQELELSGEETYGRGLGLVEYRKALNDRTALHYRLKAVYSADQLEAELKAALPDLSL